MIINIVYEYEFVTTQVKCKTLYSYIWEIINSLLGVQFWFQNRISTTTMMKKNIPLFSSFILLSLYLRVDAFCILKSRIRVYGFFFFHCYYIWFDGSASASAYNRTIPTIIRIIIIIIIIIYVSCMYIILFIYINILYVWDNSMDNGTSKIPYLFSIR